MLAPPRAALSALLSSGFPACSLRDMHGGLRAVAQAARTSQVLRQAQRFASAGGTGYGKGPYRGFVPPKVPEWQTRTGEFIATSAWLWFFWRIKLDGNHLLVR